MLYAKKLNRVYKISEAEKATYLKRGFDIVDETGKLISAAVDKTISYNEHIKEINALKEELENANKVPKNAVALKEQLVTVNAEKDALVQEKEALEQENKALKEQLAALTNGEENGEVQK